ncbi:hypothetical protein GPU96_02g02280 [Encephalitozoon hellem]|uniref:Transmembrane protein n=1 Tax=Encephalitozoon hellem TaxID=27973 RepID=A0A9Q9F7P0_ENCHE|nr:hypothetical protein GPU96_02g02280 [Encephalitozoon hellem]
MGCAGKFLGLVVWGGVYGIGGMWIVCGGLRGLMEWMCCDVLSLSLSVCLYDVVLCVVFGYMKCGIVVGMLVWLILSD